MNISSDFDVQNALKSYENCNSYGIEWRVKHIYMYKVKHTNESKTMLYKPNYVDVVVYNCVSLFSTGKNDKNPKMPASWMQSVMRIESTINNAEKKFLHSKMKNEKIKRKEQQNIWYSTWETIV